MEASCKGVVKTYKTNQCNVACPGLGDRTAGNASAIEMLFFIPESKLEMVTNNLFKAGNKQGSGFGPASNPYAIPHIVGSVGSNRIFGQVAVGDTPQWRYSRKRNVKNKK